jgi:formylglycine-generating enzyme required for sulfatase activity
MLLVEGDRPFYVDRAVVTHKQWAEFQVKHKFAKKDADKPVTSVGFDYARQYAAFRGKRLLTAAEWEAAARTPAFVPAGMKLVEWVDDGAPTGAATRQVRGVNGATGKKKAAGAADTTFRMALDP